MPMAQRTTREMYAFCSRGIPNWNLTHELEFVASLNPCQYGIYSCGKAVSTLDETETCLPGLRFAIQETHSQWYTRRGICYPGPSPLEPHGERGISDIRGDQWLYIDFMMETYYTAWYLANVWALFPFFFSQTHKKAFGCWLRLTSTGTS